MLELSGLLNFSTAVVEIDAGGTCTDESSGGDGVGDGGDGIGDGNGVELSFGDGETRVERLLRAATERLRGRLGRCGRECARTGDRCPA